MSTNDNGEHQEQRNRTLIKWRRFGKRYGGEMDITGLIDQRRLEDLVLEEVANSGIDIASLDWRVRLSVQIVNDALNFGGGEIEREGVGG